MEKRGDIHIINFSYFSMKTFCGYSEAHCWSTSNGYLSSSPDFLLMCRYRGNSHQWASFQVAGLLHTWQISHQMSRCVYHEGRYQRSSTLCNSSLSAASMSSWTSQAHAFHQPVCHRLSWLHHWSVPHVHTSGAFSPLEWGPDPQCQAVQVADWTWWWHCLAA